MRASSCVASAHELHRAKVEAADRHCGDQAPPELASLLVGCMYRKFARAPPPACCQAEAWSSEASEAANQGMTPLLPL